MAGNSFNVLLVLILIISLSVALFFLIVILRISDPVTGADEEKMGMMEMVTLAFYYNFYW